MNTKLITAVSSLAIAAALSGCGGHSSGTASTPSTTMLTTTSHAAPTPVNAAALLPKTLDGWRVGNAEGGPQTPDFAFPHGDGAICGVTDGTLKSLTQTHAFTTATRSFTDSTGGQLNVTVLTGNIPGSVSDFADRLIPTVAKCNQIVLSNQGETKPFGLSRTQFVVPHMEQSVVLTGYNRGTELTVSVMADGNAMVAVTAVTRNVPSDIYATLSAIAASAAQS